MVSYKPTKPTTAVIVTSMEAQKTAPRKTPFMLPLTRKEHQHVFGQVQHPGGVLPNGDHEVWTPWINESMYFLLHMVDFPSHLSFQGCNSVVAVMIRNPHRIHRTSHTKTPIPGNSTSHSPNFSPTSLENHLHNLWKGSFSQNRQVPKNPKPGKTPKPVEQPHRLLCQPF